MAQAIELPCARMHANARIPTRSTLYSAGLDLYTVQKEVIPARTRQLIPIGLQIRIPKGHYGRIVSRSGITLNSFVDVLPGVIDSDYRGEVQIIMCNQGLHPFPIPLNARVAQLIIQPYTHCEPCEAVYEDPNVTQRGTSGFGGF